jgi:hypothetical protein
MISVGARYIPMNLMLSGSDAVPARIEREIRDCDLLLSIINERGLRLAALIGKSNLMRLWLASRYRRPPSRRPQHAKSDVGLHIARFHFDGSAGIIQRSSGKGSARLNPRLREQVFAINAINGPLMRAESADQSIMTSASVAAAWSQKASAFKRTGKGFGPKAMGLKTFWVG